MIFIWCYYLVSINIGDYIDRKLFIRILFDNLTNINKWYQTSCNLISLLLLPGCTGIQGLAYKKGLFEFVSQNDIQVQFETQLPLIYIFKGPPSPQLDLCWCMLRIDTEGRAECWNSHDSIKKTKRVESPKNFKQHKSYFRDYPL